MNSFRKRFWLFAATAVGTTFASGCEIAEQVLNTVGFAFRIVDIWV